MKKWMSRIAVLPALVVVFLFCVAATSGQGCNSDAQVASENLSTAADNFEISRRVVFYNVITDKYILTVEGRCSIDVDEQEDQLEVTCKVADGNTANAYKKHFLGRADNVTYFVEQLDPVEVSVYHYRVVFKPQTIIPDVDLRGDPSEIGHADDSYEPSS